MQIGANYCICARPKVVNKKEYHFSQKMFRVNFGGCIYCGYCVCVTVYMAARCLNRGDEMKSNIIFRNLTDKYGT